MIWSRRKIVLAVAAGLAAAGLVTAGVVVLAGGQAVPAGQPPSRPSAPQTGLTRADIVYVLPVEGGLSRLMAVVSSRS